MSDEVRLTLRLPSDLHAQMEVDAVRNLRSTNQEVIARLSAPASEHVFPILRQIGSLALSEGGMAIRDAFAMAALPTVITLCAGDAFQLATYPTREAYFAAKAYAVADAMLVARKGGAT